MDEFIKQQLKSLKVATVPEFDDSTTYLLIKKLSNIVIKENECYLIKLKDCLLNPSYNPSLTNNWNGGSVPKYTHYKVDISKIMARMIKVNGIAFDYPSQTDINEMWSGWLPLSDIEILEKI